MVQNSLFPGNTTDRLCPPERGVSRWLDRLVSCELLVTEQLQPVRVRLAQQQFRGTFPHPFRMLAPYEPPVIQEELQQRQVVRPHGKRTFNCLEIQGVVPSTLYFFLPASV